MMVDAVGLENIKFDHDVASVENKGEKAVCHF